MKTKLTKLAQVKRRDLAFSIPFYGFRKYLPDLCVADTIYNIQITRHPGSNRTCARQEWNL